MRQVFVVKTNGLRKNGRPQYECAIENWQFCVLNIAVTFQYETIGAGKWYSCRIKRFMKTFLVIRA